MKTRFLVAALAGLGLASGANAALVGGQTLGIDFADGIHADGLGGSGAAAANGSGAETNFAVLTQVPGSARTNTGANGVNVAGQAISTDITGAALTGVTFSTAGFIGFLGTSDQVGYNAAGVGNYTGTVYSDLSYNDGIYHGGGTGTVTISGLNDALTYDLEIVANMLAVTTFGATVTDPNSGGSGAYTGAAIHNGGTNPIQPFTLSGLQTDGSGNVVIDFTNSPVIIGALTLTAVPEPGSMALLGLGGLLVARRRRG